MNPKMGVFCSFSLTTHKKEEKCVMIIFLGYQSMQPMRLKICFGYSLLRYSNKSFSSKLRKLAISVVRNR